jgi:hypothetical protein
MFTSFYTLRQTLYFYLKPIQPKKGFRLFQTRFHIKPNLWARHHVPLATQKRLSHANLIIIYIPIGHTDMARPESTLVLAIARSTDVQVLVYKCGTFMLNIPIYKASSTLHMVIYFFPL